MSNFSGALKDVTKAIRRSPCAELITNRGVIHVYLGDTTRAMEDFQRALQLDPTHSLRSVPGPKNARLGCGALADQSRLAPSACADMI